MESIRAVSRRSLWSTPIEILILISEPFLLGYVGKAHLTRKVRILFMCVLRKKYERSYFIRHTFCTHRLYEWMREGKDLNAMLPYLSAYMGHAQLSDTYYYIHLVPGQFEALSGLDFTHYENLLPEVEDDE